MIWVIAVLYAIIAVLVRYTVKESYFFCIFWPITLAIIAVATLILRFF